MSDGIIAAGIAQRHRFVDGNKRVALVVLEPFLSLNGARLYAGDAACVEAMRAVAAGVMSEESFSKWVRTHLR